MKFFTLLFFCSVLLFASSKDTCYSVQLTSFKLKKNTTYSFTQQNYPSSCKMIHFTNINAIRCGCYKKHKDVKKAYKILDKKYKNALIVKTYTYHFAQQPRRKIIKLQPVRKQQKATQQKIIIKQKSSQKQLPKKQPSFNDFLTLQGNAHFILQRYLKAPKEKHSKNALLLANLEANYKKDALSLHTKIRLQQDYYDLVSTAQHTKRSFVRLDELYGSYDFEDDKISVGKNILFWGALEVRNIADVFNDTDLRSDPFYSDKLGAWNMTYTHYTDTGEFSAIVKLYEQNRNMSAYPYIYYYFPKDIAIAQNVQLPLQYNKQLKTQASRYRPSIYLKYAGSTDTKHAIDYALIFENGYDSQRYYTKTLQSNNIFTTNEHAYLVNKFITYDTLVAGATLYKLEAIYADVLNNKEISDYSDIGIGLEHTLTQVYKEADLGLLAEYYNYHTFEKEKRNDLQLFEVFQNDLFLGMRYSFNDADNSSLVGGGIFDLDYQEEIYYLKYETRLADTFKVKFDYHYINPSKNYDTVFHLMKKHQRFSIDIGYYF